MKKKSLPLSSLKFLKKHQKKVILCGAAGMVIIVIILVGYIYRTPMSTAMMEVLYVLQLPIKISRLASQPPDEGISMPVAGVLVKNVVDTWHGPRSGGRIHEGQDIFAKKGTPVYSGTPGYILFIRSNRLGGNTVTVLGAGGRSYYYAHFDSTNPNLKYLHYVDTNSILGYVGNTGNALNTPPHLHFGIYTKDGAINPLLLLRDRK